MAAYTARRFESQDPIDCGVFAAVAASIKVESKGAFSESRKHILERISKNSY